jgi:uncharacterized protein (DUF486 family)
MPAHLVIIGCVILLILSNIFLNFAWYAHLKEMVNKPLIYAIFFSWGIAFIEYCLMVPANRYAHQYFSVGQLKIMQEAITLSVFIPISIFYLDEKWSWDYAWSALCMTGAIFFAFRSKIFS